MDNEKFQIALENFNPVLVTDQLAALNAKREAFVTYFTPEHIEGMPIEEYTIGYGNNGKHNFCYDLEHTLRGLGSIRGGSSKKFGVWYSAKENSYSHAKKYGSAQNAYEQIRKNILDLLVAGEADDIKAIIQIPLALVFKGKILSTYYPEKYLNIFTAEHLDYFLKSLDITDPADSVEEKRVLLTKFKNNHPVMKDWSLQCFSHFLYEGYPKSPDNHMVEDIRFKKYRDFILKCTMSAKSVNNYTDFRRINECLQEIYPNSELTILDIDTTEEFAEIQKQLENNDTFNNNCQQVLSAIAVQTVGYALAKQNPDYAIKESLIPLLSDAFRNSEHTLWNTNIDVLENSTTSNDICFPDNFKVSQLNNIFNIQSKGNITAETRGALCPIILEPNEDFFIDKFGYSVLEFCDLILPKIIQEDLENVQLICVEYSAACDFCQSKERTCKYLLGMAISSDLFNAKTNRGRSKLKESILRIRGIYDIQDQEKIILFNLNFSFTLPKSIMRNLIGNPLFCFQKEMMDMIGHAYASHHSRIGITTFEN